MKNEYYFTAREPLSPGDRRLRVLGPLLFAALVFAIAAWVQCVVVQP